MAIQTLDDAIGGLLPPYNYTRNSVGGEAAGIPHSMFFRPGMPGAAIAPTPGLAGEALTSYTGQLQFPATVGGEDIHLYSWTGIHELAGECVLADRLWHNSGITITQTTEQTINSVTWPARDRNGSTDGAEIQVALEVSTATGGGAVTNTTLNYTNSAGTSGRTATMTSFPATAVAGTFIPFLLQAGDLGVRSIQGLTLGTTYSSGTIHLVAYRHVARAIMAVGYMGWCLGIGDLGLPRMYDGSVPFTWVRTSTNAAMDVNGTLIYTQG